MRALLRAGGVADFLDVNIPVGKLHTQIQLIKRLLNQVGIADMLDVDLNKASLAKAAAEVDSLSATVPVTFDVSHLPVLGPVGDLTEKVTADTGPAAAAIAALQARMAALSETLTDLRVGLDDAGAVAKIASLQARLAALSNTTGNIALTADTSRLDAAIITEEAKLAALQATAGNIDLYFNTADLAKLDAQIAAVQAKIATMKAQADDIRLAFTVDDAGLAKADAQLLAMEALAQKLAGTVIPLKDLTEKVNISTAAAQESLRSLDTTLIRTSLDAIAARAPLIAMGNDLAKLDSVLKGTVDITTSLADADKILGQTSGIITQSLVSQSKAATSMEAAQAGLSASTADEIMTAHELSGVLTEIAAADTLLEGHNERLAANFRDLGSAVTLNALALKGVDAELKAKPADADAAKVSILGMAGGAMVASMAMTKLAGTFRETAGLTSWAGIIHSIFMLSMEFLAVAIPALIAFGAAADDQLQAWQDMYERMYAINVVGQSIGQTFGKTDGQILGLGDSLQKAQNAVQTQVYEILGAAINVMSGNIAGATDKTSKFADGFNAMGMSVTKTMDQFAAKIDVDLGTSTDQYIGLINKGAADLVEFGEILGNVGHAILNFASDMPGLAEVVLRVITGISGLVLWLSKLPPMLITVVMAIEEAYRWSGYLAAIFGLIGSGIAMLGSLGLPILASIGANIAKMFASIVTGAAGAILNLGMIGEKIPVIGEDVASAALTMSTGLEGVAAFLTGPWGIAIGLAVGGAAALILVMRSFHSATDDWVSSLNSVVQKSVGLAQIGATYGALQATTKALSVSQANFNTVLSAGGYSYTALNMAAGQYSGKISTLSGASKSLASDFATEGSNVGLLSRMYGVTYTEAAILAGNANANLTQTMKGNTAAAEQNLQMVKNYVAGMGGMGPISGALGADINAVTIDASLQGTQIQKLTTAWTDVMTMVQAPSAGFIGLANSLVQFNTDAGTAGATVSGLGGAVQGTAKKVTTASLQLQGDFNSAASAAQTMINSLYTTAAVTGSNSLLVQGIRDTIAVLIPLAGTNKSAAAQIHVLAQEAGLGATTSLPALAKAVGGTKDPLTDLYNISGKAAGQLADLGQDAQNLADTVQTSLNQTLVVAAQSLEGVSGKTATYLTDLQNLGSASPVTQAALADLNSAVSSSNVLAGQAAGGITALSGDNTKLGKATAAQQTNRQTLNTDIDAIIKKAPNAGKVLGNLVTAIETQGTTSLDYQTDRKTLYDDLVKLNIPGPVATQMLDNLTTAAGLTGNAADKLALQHLAPLGAGIDTLAGKAKNMAQYFTDPVIPALNNTGDAAVTNQGKVKILMQQLEDLPKNVTTNVNVHASGSGGMSFTEKVAQSVSTGSFALGVSTLAAGGKITAGTGPKTDDVLARVSRGETVVSAADSKVLAPYFKALGVPGYASGGIPAMVPWAKNAEVSFAQSAETSFLDSITSSLKTAVTAASKATAAAYNGPGTLSAQAIEGYWTGAGGPGGQTANIAQAITGPESGRRPGAVQAGQPYATTGWGLWQITPGNSEPQAGIDKALLNPHNNAIAAVAKYHGAGGFSPWTTYEDGLYLPYLMGGIQAPSSNPAPKGYASGGVPAGLAAAQVKEAKDYASAIRQAGTPPGTEARKELARLIRDQSYETGAFTDLKSGGTTAGNLSWFKSQLASMQSESAAKDITLAAPAAMAALHSELGALLRLAGGVAPVSKSSSGSSSSGTAGTPAVASSAAVKKMTAGQIAKQGAAYLKSFHGQEINPKIDWWNAELSRDSALTGASGLSKTQVKHYKSAVVADKKMLAALAGEKTVLQEWRADLSGSDASLSSWISAAGKTPSLAKNVKTWKHQLAGQESEIAGISKMLGWSAAQIAAQKAAAAAASAAAGSSSGSGTTTITPVGLTPAGALAAFTAGISGTGAKVIPGYGGSFDQGGTLATGWNTVHNGTGRPESLVPAGGGSRGKLSADTQAVTDRLDALIMAMQQNTQVTGTTGTQFGRALSGAPPKRGLTGSASLRKFPP